MAIAATCYDPENDREKALLLDPYYGPLRELSPEAFELGIFYAELSETIIKDTSREEEPTTLGAMIGLMIMLCEEMNLRGDDPFQICTMRMPALLAYSQRCTEAEAHLFVLQHMALTDEAKTNYRLGLLPLGLLARQSPGSLLPRPDKNPYDR